MSETGHAEIAEANADNSADFAARIAALCAAGAGRFDPVRLHYLEVLARRANEHEGSIKRMLDTKLEQALEALQERFEQARCDASEAVAIGVQHYPHAATEFQGLFAAGDFKGLQRLIATLKSREQVGCLGALVRQLEQHSAGNPDEHREVTGGPRLELKTLRNDRETWAKLSIDKQMSQALDQAPKNAGPINSHMLVLRSLALMRDISPAYLNRFMLYTDTLLCLDQGEKEKPPAPKKRPSTRVAKK
ncbi:MAG: hypothetical protein JWR22_2030 [Herminiimonas sp.]|nr:hypothetical protein [Herminiimonas sp.]